jgi:tubulin-specific chaperone D
LNFSTNISPCSWDDLNSLVKQARRGKKGNPTPRRLEACIKVWAGLSEVYHDALRELAGLVLHHFPKIRNAVIDELWVLKGVGKGVDWAKAKRSDEVLLWEGLGLQMKPAAKSGG